MARTPSSDKPRSRAASGNSITRGLPAVPSITPFSPGRLRQSSVPDLPVSSDGGPDRVGVVDIGRACGTLRRKLAKVRPHRVTRHLEAFIRSVNVGIDHRQELGGGRRTVLRERGAHDLLAELAVFEILVELGDGVGDDIAVARRDGAESHGLQTLELRDIRAHIAIWWTNHDRRTVHDVIAGEQRAVLLE